MLEKRDKLKKSTQLPLEEKDSGPSAEELLRSKRRLVIILLCTTVGLSLIFWTYRTFKNFSLPNFSFPKISPQSKVNSNPSQNISQLVSADSSTWSLYFKVPKKPAFTVNPDSTINDTFVTKQIEILDKSKTPNTGLLATVMPEGLVIKDIITETTSQIVYQGIIKVPENQIYFYLKINGQNLANSKKLIPQIIETYYWSVIKNL